MKKAIQILTVLAIPLLAWSEVDTYWPECWRGEVATRFHPSSWPPVPFLAAEVDMGLNEPSNGYPIHSGIVKGVSDTIVAIITFRNQSASNYSIGTQTPQNWFVPEVYNIAADVEKEPVLYDTSKFGFGFKYWAGYDWKKISAPSGLYVEGKDSSLYSLVYYVWNLPVGEYRVIFKKTSSAPSSLTVVNGWDKLGGLVWIVEPKDIADTINAMAQSYYRATSARDLTAITSIANSMITSHPKSIVGYYFRYLAGGDSLASIARLDSVIKFCNNYSDRALPDSAGMNYYQTEWRRMILGDVNWFRYNILNPTPGYIQIRQ